MYCYMLELNVIKSRMFKDLFEWINTNFTSCFLFIYSMTSSHVSVLVYKLNYKDEVVSEIHPSPLTSSIFQHMHLWSCPRQNILALAVTMTTLHLLHLVWKPAELLYQTLWHHSHSLMNSDVFYPFNMFSR